jgi:hypothetical protein
MVPKFKRPLGGFVLRSVAIAFWTVSGLMALQLWTGRTIDEGLQLPPSMEPPMIALAAGMFAAGMLFFGLGCVVHHAAAASHYLKYLCWENRLANQLAEKQKAERPIPPPSQDFSTLDPLERLFRTVAVRPGSRDD